MKHMSSHSTPRRGGRFRNRGVTLIEVLIAVMVLSIGLLGIAGLQVATTKYKLGSGVRASIAVLYSDFSDRVRLNPDMAGPNWLTGATSTDIKPSIDLDSSKYTYKATWADQQKVWTTQKELSDDYKSLVDDNTPCYVASTCSQSERAAYDMTTWRMRVRESLPQGAVFVEGNRKSGIDVTLMWMDKENTDKSVKTNDGNTATQVSLVTASNCSTTNSETGLAQQTCCPETAVVPAGVRCTRFSFMP